MILKEFVDKFVNAFDDYIQEKAAGDMTNFLILRQRFNDLAVEYYDDAIDNSISVNTEYLYECIEHQKLLLDA